MAADLRLLPGFKQPFTVPLRVHPWLVYSTNSYESRFSYEKLFWCLHHNNPKTIQALTNTPTQYSYRRTYHKLIQIAINTTFIHKHIVPLALYCVILLTTPIRISICVHSVLSRVSACFTLTRGPASVMLVPFSSISAFTPSSSSVTWNE